MADVQNADFYAAEALAADMDRWLTYDKSTAARGISIDTWLEENRPSETLRTDGIGWISVNPNAFTNEESDEGSGDDESEMESDGPAIDEDSNNTDTDDSDDLGDVLGLQQSWEAMKKSARPINFGSIADLARMHSVTYGKWLCFVDTGPKADNLWSKVAKSIVNGQISSPSAKISPFDPTADSTSRHVLCVYNKNFLLYDEVFQLEKDLRRIGVKCPLQYKPDIYTYIGIYRKNEWGLSPTLFKTAYDVMLKDSKLIYDRRRINKELRDDPSEASLDSDLRAWFPSQ